MTLNVPAGGGPNYVHTFNLTTAVAGTVPFSGFAAVVDGQIFVDGTSANNFIFDPNLTYSSYGLWANITNVTGTSPNFVDIGANGVVAFGQLTPANAVTSGAIPTTSNLTYSGRTIGVMVDGSNNLGLIGNSVITANFGTMKVNGTFDLSTVNPNTLATTPWTNLTMPQTSIVSGVGFPYTGSVTGMVGATSLNGTAFGNFYGPAANETAGTWSVAGGTIHAIGAYGAKR